MRPLGAPRSALRHLPAAILTTVLGATLVAVSPAPSQAAGDTWAVPRSATVTLTGHGYGHGHGMSQYGAYGAAKQGLTAQQITDFYYPATSRGTSGGKVSVLISADQGNNVIVLPRKRLMVKDSAVGGKVVLPTRKNISKWRIAVAGNGKDRVSFRVNRTWRKWRDLRGTGEFVAAGRPITLVTPAGKRAYRGRLRAVPAPGGARQRDTVNVLSLENYLRGVVPLEMPASWHPEAVGAQAIAARTYASFERNHPRSSGYQICDTTSCQVYGGAWAEHPASDAAIRATSKQILIADGEPAFTQFSSSSGGWTSAGSRPYLAAQEDPYDDFPGNSVHDWTVTVSDLTVERAFPGIGDLTDIVVTRRDGNGQWGGRVLAMTLTGSKGSQSISGDTWRSALGLRSTWVSFSVRSR